MGLVWAFLVVLVSGASLTLGLSIPLKIWARRRRAGVPAWRHRKIVPVDERTPFPRALFSMIGQTGGPLPLRAPLSEIECYYFEITFRSFDKPQENVKLLEGTRDFTFFSPKGAVTLSPKEFTRDLDVVKKIERWSRFPLPLVVRERAQRLGLGDGVIEERVLPAYRKIQLVGRAARINPTSFRLRKGPGVFPLISTGNVQIQRMTSDGALTLSVKQWMQAIALCAAGASGFYLVQTYLLLR